MQIKITDKKVIEDFNQVKRDIHITSNISTLEYLIGLHKDKKQKKESV